MSTMLVNIRASSNWCSFARFVTLTRLCLTAEGRRNRESALDMCTRVARVARSDRYRLFFCSRPRESIRLAAV